MLDACVKLFRKCNLGDIIDVEEMDNLYQTISRSWIGMHTTGEKFYHKNILIHT